jgi:hypothetical protein
MTTLTITYGQPINNTPNVTLATVNANVAAIMGSDSVVGNDYQSLVSTIMVRGYWNGNTFIPARQITLVTAS